MPEIYLTELGAIGHFASRYMTVSYMYDTKQIWKGLHAPRCFRAERHRKDHRPRGRVPHPAHSGQQPEGSASFPSERF